MGNRCVITNKEKTRAIYQHWNGGRDSIESLLKVAKLLGGGFDKLCEISSKVFDGEEISCDEVNNGGLDCSDNGVYIIDENLEIIGREGLRYEREQRAHNLLDMVLFIYLNFRVDDKTEVRELFDLLEALKKESQSKKGQ